MPSPASLPKRLTIAKVGSNRAAEATTLKFVSSYGGPRAFGGSDE